MVDSKSYASHLVADDKVFWDSFDNNTYALNAENSAFQWSNQTAGKIYSSPTIANGVSPTSAAMTNTFTPSAQTSMAAPAQEYRAPSTT